MPGLLWKASERYAGEEEKGLREGYHARVRYSRLPHGGERLPPLAEMERVLEERRGGREMPTLMDARAMEWEARVLDRGREQGIAQGRAEERAPWRSGASAPRRQGRFRSFSLTSRARRISSRRATGAWNAGPAANCPSGSVARVGK